MGFHAKRNFVLGEYSIYIIAERYEIHEYQNVVIVFSKQAKLKRLSFVVVFFYAIIRLFIQQNDKFFQQISTLMGVCLYL